MVNEETIKSDIEADINVTMTQYDISALKSIHDYLHSRPMNETEQGVFFIRTLVKRINESA